ncbi:tyrosine-protein phosphatase [Pediococcus ethanolidurans]|uniref:tyrosine-protein phosphatase n=1 Tax=Pediococcus ethanolidurans TaxID=319653 RepID=UPI0021E82305|nr:tyrosine-protein phosphatase [Pediococcus ethanolidurans]MCV3554776.1 tyrosine-protein phosphatase [Pediococcus ethanolidurans]
MVRSRVLQLQKGGNFRELGGYQTIDGHTIKWHKIIRSGKLGNLTDQDVSYLNNYGLKYDVDFRSPEEKAQAPDRIPQQTKYLFMPVFSTDETQNSKQTDYLQRKMESDPTTGRQQMHHVYQDIITNPHSQKAYRQFFDVLLENDVEQDTLLFHCTAGKDRTGMGAIFFLSALGVNEDTIKADYLLTNKVTKPVLEDLVKTLKLKNAPSAFIQSMRDLQSVQISFYNTAMEQIQKTSGDMPNYLHEYLNLSATDIHDLQRIYLE